MQCQIFSLTRHNHLPILNEHLPFTTSIEIHNKKLTSIQGVKIIQKIRLCSVPPYQTDILKLSGMRGNHDNTETK